MNTSTPENNSIKLIVGLGNPGQQYAITRHNVGQSFVETLAKQHNAAFYLEAKFKGYYTTINFGNTACRLLIPTTFMNLSGEAVKSISSFYKIDPEAILVAHDDLDFPPGTIKLKFNGGHGGHNGLRNIIQNLQSSRFYRLRIGIGHPGDKNLVTDYVLQAPSKNEQDQISASIEKGLAIIPLIIEGDMERPKQYLS